MSRTEKIFQEVQDEEKVKMEKIQNQTKNIHNDLIIIQKRIIDITRDSCKNEYKWLEQNGDIILDDSGFRVIMKDNYRNEEEIKLKELSICLENNDFGLKNYFDKVNIRLSSLNSNFDLCLDSCVEHEDDKIDSDIKICMKNCFSSNYNDYNQVFSNIENKIAEINQKI